MSANDDLLEGSYKGFKFGVIKSSNTEGNAVAIHEYVSTSRRFVEYTGGMPPEFDLTIIISGNDVFEKADRFRALLNQGSPGLLVHPERGEFTVSNGVYTSSTEDTKVGQVSFNVTFYTDAGAVFPTRIRDNKRSVLTGADKARDIAEESFLNTYKNPESVKSAETLADKIASVSDSIEESIRDAIGDQELLDEISFTINELRNAKTKLVRQPSNLISKIKGIHSNMQGLSIAYKNIFKLSTFGISDTAFSPLNNDRINRQASLRSLNQINRMNNYVSAVEQVAQFDFSTTNQVEDARDSIESFYNDIVNDDLVKNSDNASNFQSGLRDSVFSVDNDDRYDTLSDILNEMQRSCLSILDQEAVSLPSITEIDLIQEISLNNLCYSLYGDYSNNDLIARLNPLQDYLRMTGSIKVVS